MTPALPARLLPVLFVIVTMGILVEARAAHTGASALPASAIDASLERLWWMAFAVTMSACVLVLVRFGLGVLRGRQIRQPWVVPEEPAVAARSRHFGPHL